MPERTQKDFSTRWIQVGCGLAALSILLGAFGAHLLQKTLTPKNLGIFQLGVHYQMLHSLGLILVGIGPLLSFQRKPLTAAAWFFTSGILLFSGSLYILALTNLNKIGMITPFGGICFVAGWVCFAMATRRRT